MRIKDYFMSAQESVAAGLAREGVTVVFDAKDAPYADLKNRVMHLRPLPDEMSPTDLEDCRGDADHETAHFMFTDIDALKIVQRDGCPFLKILVNVIEDGRIEREISDRYFGCAENIANSGERAIDELLEKVDGTDKTTFSKAFASLSALAFGKPEEQVLERFGADCEPYLDEIREHLGDIGDLRSTFEVVDKAKAIREIWRRHADKFDEETPEKTPKGGAEGGGGSEKTDPGENPSGLEGPAGDPSDGSPGEDSEGSEDDEREVSAAALEKMADALDEASVAKIRKQKVASQEFDKKTSYIAYTADDVYEEISTHRLTWVRAGMFLKEVQKTVPTLRRRLFMEFLGERPKAVRNQRKGKLDDRRLHRVPMGCESVFYRRRPSIEKNAFVHLLVDASGSMSSGVGSKLYVAAQCAAAMSQTLDALKIDHECTSFTTTVGRLRDAKEAEIARIGDFDRVTPLRCLIVKKKQETFRKAREKFAALGHYNRVYQNIDGECLLWAAKRIAEQASQGAKPVLIVFSDGEPWSGFENNKTLARHLKRSVKRIEDAGIALIGVGINSNSVKSFYDDNVVVSTLSELPDLFFPILRRVLRKTSTIHR